jgi:hypothetical protein
LPVRGDERTTRTLAAAGSSSPPRLRCEWIAGGEEFN